MANLTRADVEAQVILRIGTLLSKVGLDGTTIDGSNASLNDGIRRGVRALGYPVADPAIVADGDLAAIPTDWTAEKLYDLAEMRTLESVWGNWAEVKRKLSLQEQELQQLADRIEARIAVLEGRLRKPYGPNLPVAVAAGSTRARHIPRDPRLDNLVGGRRGGYGGWPGGRYGWGGDW